MNNDGTNFFNFAIAVAVACNADTRPKGETKPEAAAQYIQNVLDMAFVNTGLKFRVKPLAYLLSEQASLTHRRSRCLQSQYQQCTCPRNNSQHQLQYA